MRGTGVQNPDVVILFFGDFKTERRSIRPAAEPEVTGGQNLRK